MTSLRLFPAVLPLLLGVACTDAALDPASDPDLALAEADAVGGKSDGAASWGVAPTLHVGARVFDGAAAGGRRVHPLWLAGSPGSPVTIDVAATAHDGGDVRIAVLGPLRNGSRAVLAADGYASARAEVAVDLSITTTGEHLVVVGSYGLATETSYDLAARCAPSACDGARIDVLASPKAGALVGNHPDRLVSATLGDVLSGRTFDVELELWASPPAQPWNAALVATSVASGSQVNVLVPGSVAAGDDLRLVVREAGGAVLDTGVVTRFAPTDVAFARTDSILYGDLASLEISGVVGFYEGVADLRLRSEDRALEIAAYTARADRPGALGMGFGAFDATFAPELVDVHGNPHPTLPSDGELLSLGSIDGNGGYRRLACFEYCNDLAGQGTCTGGPRACP